MSTPFNAHRRSQRLKQEIQQLSEEYGRVRIDHDHDAIVIDRFVYPDGWTPRTAPFMIRPTTLYPRQQPAGYIPERMRYTEGIPRHMWKTQVEGYVRWCMHPVPWKPAAHSLTTFVDLLEESLANPTETDPWTWSDELSPEDLPDTAVPQETNTTRVDVDKDPAHRRRKRRGHRPAAWAATKRARNAIKDDYGSLNAALEAHPDKNAYDLIEEYK